MNRCVLPLAALVLMGAGLRANEAPPPPPKGETIKLGAREVKLVVERDERVKEARLVIPQGLLTADKRRTDAGWPLPTLVAGLALAAAFVSGGLWLARRGGRKVAAVVLVLSLLALGISALQANAPDRERDLKPKVTPIALPASVTLSGNLVLEVAEKGDSVKLIVNSSMLPKTPTKEK
jgi:hypothetical protein